MVLGNSLLAKEKFLSILDHVIGTAYCPLRLSGMGLMNLKVLMEFKFCTVQITTKSNVAFSCHSGINSYGTDD